MTIGGKNREGFGSSASILSISNNHHMSNANHPNNVNNATNNANTISDGGIYHNYNNQSSGTIIHHNNSSNNFNKNTTSLFRQNNKIVSTSVNKLNDTSKCLKKINFLKYYFFLENTQTNITNTFNNNTISTNTVNFISPIKQKKDSKPIEEILKSTQKMLDSSRMKETTQSSANVHHAHRTSTIKEVNENLKVLKKRTQTVLEVYSEMILKSSQKDFSYSQNKRKNQFFKQKIV